MPIPTIDFSIFDNEELLSYVPTSDPSVDNVKALRRPLTQSTQRNVERFVELHATDVVFHLDASLLAATTLASGDVVVDAGGQHYQVLFIERQVFNNCVAAVCRPVDV
jgi:hypothetical protein